MKIKKIPAVAGIFLLLPSITFSQKTPDFLSRIGSHNEFEMLAGDPLSAKFGQVDAVKVVYAIRLKKMYYIHSKRFRFHYDFCHDYLGDPQDLYRFNYNNYSESSARKYFLANINYFKSTGKYYIEFSPADYIKLEDITTFYQLLKDSFFAGDSLKVYMNTTRLITEALSKKVPFPFVTPGELYGNLQLQTVSQTQGEGTLIKVTGAEVEKMGDCSDKILLIQGGSNYVPLCAGIITTEFQTPLSHISILARNRKIPVVAWKNAWDNKQLDELNGNYISLKVGEDSFYVAPAKKPADTVRKITKLTRLSCDSSTNTLADISGLRYKSVKTYGAKAANLGELNRVLSVDAPLHLPEGAFAIPFYHYCRHVKKYGIDRMIEIACTENWTGKRKELELLLLTIRDSILHSPIEEKLLVSVQNRMEQSKCGKRYRFRSSSNAEDLNGFNGAGLYDSKTGIAGDSLKTIERAIKSVWASLWNTRAFDERVHFHIDQLTVAMAVLCHRAFPGETVNGVAITKNLYRDYEAGYIINAQTGETSVVAPPQGVTCDQLISFLNTNNEFFNSKNAIEYLSFSSLTNDKHVLTDEEIHLLTKQLSAIKKHFYSKTGASSKYSFREYALDVEFKIYPDEKGNRKLYIKQVRPFY